MFNGLYDIWNDAKRRGMKPAWANIGEFIAWARDAGYKAAYGYKGEFTPQSLKLAIPKAPPIITEKPKGADDLVKTMKLDELKELAADMEIELKGATTKKEIAEKITEVQNG